MAHLITDSKTFAAQAIAGFAAAHSRYVRPVSGGVVRSTVIPTGQVTLVIGGGSGHYPSFAGLVGPGLAAGAVCGNIFASPSSGQVHRVCHSVNRQAGMMLVIGNYAGDVLQFGLGAERLRGEGADVRLLAVTDDIASAPPDQIQKRRGIAGLLAVFKIAGAAAEAGRTLDDVERVARHANDRVRSLGVAFSGCTLPGAPAPLFTVMPGRMAVGLGIHGEPGISEVPVPDAPGLADLLVGRLLAEMPTGVDARSGRAVVILNGLGGFKYEELFTLFGAVHERLAASGITIADTECGELVTSLEMAGVSLTLFWVDDELEALWKAPADSPAYRRGSVQAEPDTAHARPSSEAPELASPTAQINGDTDTAAAALVLERLRVVQRALSESEQELGRLDAVAGDGDHGIGMSRGVAGAVAAADRVAASGGGIKRLLLEAGEAWSEQGGGTSGALWGIALTAAGANLPAAPATDAMAISRSVDAALTAMQRLGKAQIGDKTMIDAVAPFAEALRRSVVEGRNLAGAWSEAARCATEAAAETARLLPRIGRARPHAEKSRGHPDAGAVSFARIVTAAGSD